jgi:hypothetical protein
MPAVSLGRMSFVISALALISGCASAPAYFAADANLSNDGGANPPHWATSAAMQSRIKEVHAICADRSTTYGNQTDQSRKLSFGLATIGIVAGSIIVPALAAKATVAKSAIAAWGGVSGAANAGQLAMRSEGFSTSDRLKSYIAFKKDVDDQYKALAVAPSSGQALLILAQIENTCGATPPPAGTP